MKRFNAIASLLVLLTIPMFGSTRKPQTVIIPENVQVGTTKLPAGTYKLAWTGTEPDVQVTLTQSGKTVLTFAAKATETKNSNAGVDVDLSSGTAILKAIILSDLNLRVQPTQQSGQ